MHGTARHRGGYSGEHAQRHEREAPGVLDRVSSPGGASKENERGDDLNCFGGSRDQIDRSDRLRMTGVGPHEGNADGSADRVQRDEREVPGDDGNERAWGRTAVENDGRRGLNDRDDAEEHPVPPPLREVLTDDGGMRHRRHQSRGGSKR
jgi:hypothetical protein